MLRGLEHTDTGVPSQVFDDWQEINSSWYRRVFFCTLRTLFVLINNLYCIPTYVIWCVLLSPLLLIHPKTFWKIEGKFFHMLLTMVAYWSYSANYYIVETGDNLDKIVEPTIIIANHQSTSDVPLLMAAFASRKHILPRLNWIMDAVFKYTNFGVVSWIHRDFFILAGRENRDASIQELIRYLKNTFKPLKRRWLVLFPEGGFLRKRKETSNRYCRKLNLPELEHVTLPRMGAIQAIMNTLAEHPKGSHASKDSEEEYLVSKKQFDKEWKPENCEFRGRGAVPSNLKVKHNPLRYYTEMSEYTVLPPLRFRFILDITIAYPFGKPLDLLAIMSGNQPPCAVHFHYRLYNIADVPRSESKLQEWLYERFYEKERMLAQYYETGMWPNPVPELGRQQAEQVSKTVHFDLLNILLMHLFFIASTFFHVQLIRYLIYCVPL